MKASRNLKKILTNICVGMLIVAYFGTMIAMPFAGQINGFLHTSNTKIEYIEGADSSVYPRYFETVYKSVKELKEAGLAKAQEVEAEGAVLLMNNGILPLSGKDVSLFGATASNPVYGGTGSGAVSTEDAPSFADAMKKAGLNVTNEALLKWYVDQEYVRTEGGAINEAKWSKIKKAAGFADVGKGEVAVFIVGRVGGEANDLKVTNSSDGGSNPLNTAVDANADYLMLNKEEQGILKGLKAMKDEGQIKGIVVLFNSANPLSCDFLSDPAYGVDAAMWIGSVGQTGIFAVGELLTGKVNPSGSLPDTWWTNNLLNPVMANFGAYTYEGADAHSYPSSQFKFANYVVYQEGIYLGYRYTETRYEDVILGTPKTGNFDYDKVVAFPFGHGLSYTSFSFSDMQVVKEGEGNKAEYVVKVTVTNTGSVAGKKTVQIYAQKPYTQYDIEHGIEKAAVDFVGYAKTAVLQPGASEVVTVKVPEYFLASYDALGTGVYILEDGAYYLTAAENAHDATNNILAAKGKNVGGNKDLTFKVDYTFDAETYAKAYGSGNAVTSLFAGADINRYEGKGDNKVTYISRNNWEGTVVLFEDKNGDGINDNFVKLVMTDLMYKDIILDEADIPENDGNWPTMGSTATSWQLINLMKDEEGNPRPFDDPMWDELLNQLSYDEMAHLCAIGLRMTGALASIGKPETLDHNGPSGVTQKYNGNSQSNNGYAIKNNDPDGGMTGTCFPCNGIIAATMNDKLAEEVGEIIGEDAAWAGYAGFYGSGVNIHRAPYAGRVFEYYSEDGILTGLIDAYETRGIQSKGVYVYNKHFALNDQELNRQGLGTWCNEQAMREIYLRAFELPIVNADAKCVMTAFNRIGAVWAGANYNLITGWLRGEAGMSGHAVTDMYEGDYMSKPHEILAGNDIPDNYPGTTGTGVSGGSEKLLGFEFADYAPDGKTPNAQVARALRDGSHRVLYTVVQSRGMDGIDSNMRIVNVTPWWQTALVAVQVVFLVLSLASACWLVLDIYPNILPKKKN